MSRRALIDFKFSTVICAPVYSSGEGLATQVAVGPEEGLKHTSWIMCDNLVSLRKTDLTHYLGSLRTVKQAELDNALRRAETGPRRGTRLGDPSIGLRASQTTSNIAKWAKRTGDVTVSASE